MPKLTEIAAIPISERYRKDAFAIHSAKPAPPVAVDMPPSFGIMGESNDGEFSPGVAYRFYGVWDHSKKTQYGSTFKFNSFCSITPHGHAGVVAYLRQVSYVGPATAEVLWEEFGSDAVRVLREEPEKATETYPRLKIDKAKAASAELQELHAAENVTIQLMDLFDGRGFGKNCVKQAIKIWGAEAVEVLNRNPYKSMAFRGVGFLKADKLYIDLGKPPGRLKRQAYCMAHYTLTKCEQEGHTWTSIDHGINALKATVAGTEVRPERALELAVRGGLLVKRVDHEGQVWISDRGRAHAERFVCNKIAHALETDRPNWPSVDSSYLDDLSSHQLEQLAAALASPIGFLGGRPGTGKSYTLVRLVHALIALHGANSVAVMAPTGKAASRVKELMAEAKLDGVVPTTIHRGLGVLSAEDGWSFVHGEDNPLECRFLIVEEASMVGTGLLRSLIAARDMGCNVLFVGDVNQLPPVEYGAPLRDMIDAGLPYGELTKIYRNAGTIVRACSAIVDSKPWEPDDDLDLEAEEPKNLVLVSATRGSAVEQIKSLLRRIEATSPYDPVWDTQVVVAVNKRSSLSRVNLNTVLQELLNPHPPDVNGNGRPKSIFRPNDKVIQLKNGFLPHAVQNQKKEWKPSDDLTMVANGEIGRVLAAEEKKTIVEFPSDPKPRVVFIPKGKGNDEGDTGCDLDLAYAVTCHKLQGSQAPVIITCLDEYPGASGQYGVCDRAWLYTALSRAKVVNFMVGIKPTADAMTRRTFIQRRKTFMTEDIRVLAAERGVVLPIDEEDLW